MEKILIPKFIENKGFFVGKFIENKGFFVGIEKTSSNETFEPI